MSIISKVSVGCAAVLTVGFLGCSDRGGPSRAPSERAYPTLDFAEFNSFRSLTVKPDKDCDENCVKLRNEFAYVVNTGELVYAYWDFKIAETGLDYTALARELEKKITTSTSQSEYALILRRWAASFHDGHVNAMFPDDLTPLEMYSMDVRFEVIAPDTDHEALIIVNAGGLNDLHVGDKVITLDGVSAHDALDKVEEFSSGSTKRMRRFFATRKLTDVLGVTAGSQALKLEVQRTDGTHVNIEVPRQVVLNLPPSTTAAAEDTGASLFKATVLPNQIGYLRIDAFIGTQDELLLSQAMDRLAGTKALILDLRKNGGGDQSGNKIISRLISQKVIRYKTSENLNPFLVSQRPEYFFLEQQPDGRFAAWHNLDVEPANADQKTYLNKPVFAITSANCFSACDTFAAALKSNHLAKIVGEPTGGGTGTPLVFDLPVTKMQFRYSVVRGKTSDDQWIEGQGTTPDVVIEPTAEDRISHTDGQLAKVIQLAVAASSSAQTEAADATKIANGVIKQFGHPLDQSLEIAPSVADDLDLKRFARRDELK